MTAWPAMLKLALFVVLLGAVARAEDKGNAHAWLGAEQEQSLSDTVPPKPEPGSDIDKDDLAKVLHLQMTRTDAMVLECFRDQKFSYTLFQSVYGDGLTPENSPRFFQMLENITSTTSLVNGTAKKKYQRPRPYQAHPDQVKALFAVEGFSYPSGHAMGSFTLAVVLGAVFPEKKQALLHRAARIAQSRVDAGVHNPSDIAAGEVLGRATGAAILASPAFQDDLAKVRAELKKKPALTQTPAS